MNKTKSDWIDISVPLRDSMVHWPDNPPVSICKTLDLSKGDACNLTRISMGVHTATHMDAPSHFIPGAKCIEDVPFSSIMGEARVLEIRDKQMIRAEELRKKRVREGEIILFKTVNSRSCWRTNDFKEKFVYLSSDAAEFLSRKKIKTVGIDYLSVGGYKADGEKTHRILLSSGIWIIEGLNLSSVQQGKYELICLPLKLEQGDGAPARAILRSLKRR